MNYDHVGNAVIVTGTVATCLNNACIEDKDIRRDNKTQQCWRGFETHNLSGLEKIKSRHCLQFAGVMW